MKKTMAVIIISTYILALVPALFFFSNPFHRKVPKPVVFLYAIGFVLSALGFEIWWTFGLIPPGQGVDYRRCPQDLNCIQNRLLPQEINWIINSLFDTGIVCMAGLWFVLKVWDQDVLVKWHWKVFFFYLVLFVGQNLIVELLISGQISGEEEDELFISWAPLSPIGPGWNPSFHVFGGARISLQNQLPWTLMTPIFYGCCIIVYRRDSVKQQNLADIDKLLKQTQQHTSYERFIKT